MALILKDLVSEFDSIVPNSLAENWDNVGLLFGSDEELIEKALITMDVTLEVIEEAKNEDCKLIISHHPFIFSPINRITNESTIGKKIQLLSKYNIAVISLHTNADSVRNGLNDLIMNELSLESICNLEENGDASIGKVANVNTTLLEILNTIEEKFKPTAVKFTGDPTMQVKKVAVVNGSGSDYLKLALEENVDVFITGDTKYHDLLDYKELGMAVIDMGHFDSEWIIFNKFIRNITSENEKFKDIELLSSSKSKDVYKIFKK